MPLLFSYGTLQDERVQRSTFGRLLAGRADALPGFEPALVPIDPGGAAESGSAHHANVVFTGREGHRVTGTAFEVTDAELAAADDYERRADYTRVAVTLASGAEAWVYTHRGLPAARANAEVWLRGPIDGVPPLLQPVAHSLLQCREELEALLASMAPHAIWNAPEGRGSIGFHVRHALGSLDRLFTYARGAMLSDAQLQILKQEATPDPDLTSDDLLAGFDAAVERSLDQLRSTDPSTLTDARLVGRAKLPSTVIGLLFHAAEHTQRHLGQAATTKKWTRT